MSEEPGIGPPGSPGVPDGRDLRLTYLAVVVVEIGVLLALWLFSRHFGI